VTIVSLPRVDRAHRGRLRHGGALLFAGETHEDVVDQSVPPHAPRHDSRCARRPRAFERFRPSARAFGRHVAGAAHARQGAVDWVVRKLSTTEIDLRDPRDPSTAFLGHVTPMPAGPTFEAYLIEHVTHAP
jgi:hypothetical protein